MDSSFKELTPEQASALIHEQPAHVLDIRDPQSFEFNHLDGAQNIGDHNLQDFLAKADRARPLLCYCYHGINSQMAAQYFLSQGFKEIYHVIGGFEAWDSAYPESKA